MFQRKFDSIDALANIFSLNHIHYFELTQVMHKIDDQIIEVFNKFQATTHNPSNIRLLNHICLRLPPNDLNFPCMYYTNKSTKEINDFIFQNIQR